MGERRFVLLAYLALGLVLVGTVNFFASIATHREDVSLFITHPLGMVAMFYLLIRVILPRLRVRLVAAADTGDGTEPPAPLTPAQERATTVVLRVVYGIGMATALGFAVLGVVMLIRQPTVFFVMWTASSIAGVVLVTRFVIRTRLLS